MASTDSSWHRFCNYFFACDQLGIALDISRMQFSDSFLDSMRDSANNALRAMNELEAGAIANPDEGRMVGHYWLRNPALAPNATISSAIEQSINDILSFSQQIHRGEIRSSVGQKFTQVLLIGIGGSALGPQLMQDCFARTDAPMHLHFFDNTDPDGMERTLSQLSDKLEETLVLVVSKSGGTLETRNGQLIAADIFTRAGLDFSKHAVAITMPQSALDSQASKAGWLKRFAIWDWVGGRTSIFSAVGLVPAALLGIDVQTFLQGARSMDQLTRNSELQDNPAMLLALMWHWVGEGRGKSEMVVLPYKDRLLLFSKYLQQLVMESLGKERNLDGEIVHQGLSVFGNKGSTDQHAYVQQLRDGKSDFFATFIEVLTRVSDGQLGTDELFLEESVTAGDYLEGFLLGTREALSGNHRNSITITMERIDEQSLGALIALYERAVGLYASLININAYHQPGVEAGKKAAASVIALQKELIAYMRTADGELTAEEVATNIGMAEQSETIFKVLCSLSFSAQAPIQRTGGLHPQKARFSGKA